MSDLPQPVDGFLRASFLLGNHTPNSEAGTISFVAGNCSRSIRLPLTNRIRVALSQKSGKMKTKFDSRNRIEAERIHPAQ
jgi:hypothetical protein